MDVRKGAVGRLRRTWFRLTAEGAARPSRVISAWLAQLEEAVSAGLGRGAGGAHPR